ncbi:flippase-like domain-containing protein [Candidatus Micrarchaeota archaeon]|nr:flippase-like domain-containing protein [Candidatus Micrarchaeota archaeon]
MDRSYIVKLSLSVLIFIALLYFIGIDQIVSVLAKAKPEFIITALLSYVLVNVSMSYRIKLVLDELGHKLKLQTIFPSSLAGLLASDVTPARSGYFFTAFSISSKANIPLEKTMLSVFGPQIFDFLIKVFSAFVLFLIITQKTGFTNIFYTIILLVGFLIGVIAAALLVFYPPFMKMVSFLRIIPFMPRIFDFLSKMQLHSEAVLKIKGKILLITLISWLLKATEWFFLSRAIGLSFSNNDVVLDFAFMMVFQAAITIIQFLPIPTVAGAGASEAGFVAILVLFNVPFAVSATFALLTRFSMLFVDLFSIPVLLDYLHKNTLDFDKLTKGEF